MGSAPPPFARVAGQGNHWRVYSGLDLDPTGLESNPPDPLSAWMNAVACGNLDAAGSGCREGYSRTCNDARTRPICDLNQIQGHKRSVPGPGCGACKGSRHSWMGFRRIEHKFRSARAARTFASGALYCFAFVAGHQRPPLACLDHPRNVLLGTVVAWVARRLWPASS